MGFGTKDDKTMKQFEDEIRKQLAFMPYATTILFQHLLNKGL